MNSRATIVGAIIAKDLKEFTRDRFYLFMSILGLVFYILIFWLLNQGKMPIIFLLKSQVEHQYMLIF